MLANNDTSKFWDFYDDDLTFTSKLLLMDTPTTILVIWVLYIIFILKLGPQVMKNRPAFNLNNILAAYNAAQVVLSAYVVYRGVPILWKHGLIPKCHNNKDDTIGYLTTFHIYYLLKVSELLDTVFFTLRKKFKQASFLHVYHHSYMVLSTWFIVRYDPTYATLFPGVLNSFVHVVMYTYYGLSAYPSLARYLWWKKYITSLQLIQFVMIISHFIRSYHTSNCPPTFLMAYSMIANCTLFIILFSDFYIKSYKKPKSEAKSFMSGVEEKREFRNGVHKSKVCNALDQNCTNDNVENFKRACCSKDNCKLANGLAESCKKIM